MQNKLNIHNHLRNLSICWLFLVWGTISSSCQNSTESTNKLNIDRDIPPSESFDASYGFWGPNGETIYFTHSEELGSDPDPGKLDQLWKVDVDDTGNRQMIHTGRILNADISPDGLWIVFHSFSLPQYLYKMRSDGSELQRLSGPDSPNPNLEHTGLARWSPDGKRILFSIYAGKPRGTALMDSSGSNTRIIIPYGIDAKWFPDGTKIIYLNWDTTQVSNKQQQIYVANADGTNQEKLTDLTHSRYMGDVAEPIVSPNEKSIAFTHLGSNGYDKEIFIMKIDGNGIEQITEGPGYATRPEWSPDGNTLLFSRIIPNVSKRLYYLDVNTREVTPVFPA